MQDVLPHAKKALIRVQVMRQTNSILMSLTNACVLREGQLLEVPGLGNGTSVCSDDSRLEDPPTTELLVLSPRHTGQVTMRSPPPVRSPANCAVSLCDCGRVAAH